MVARRAATAPEGDRLQSVKRSLAVLEALATRPDGATPKEISQALGLHLSTSYRVLNTLVAAGYAVRCEGGGLFRLGSRVAFLHQGYLSALQPPREAIPFIHALQLATGETAVLMQLEGDDAVETAVVAGSRQGAGPNGYVGLAVTAHTIAAGRVLLAWLSMSQIEAYLERHAIGSDSPFPVTNLGELRAELARIRELGYALDLGSYPDVGCVAAPLVNGHGEVCAAISAVGPATRFRREEQSLIDVVVAVARAIGSLQLHHIRGAKPAAADHAEDATQAKIEAAITAITEEMSRVDQGRPSAHRYRALA